ncbi:MAG: PorT family protein [Bacteroidales bacterium]|nr:PorT family protein [Bacteroidales bacterium]
MKKLLLVLAVVLFANVARAEGVGFHFGPKLGYQTANLSLNKADIQSGFSEHFTIGIFGRVTFKNIMIQPELLWFKSGQIFNLDGTDLLDFDPSLTMSQQNLALPILVGYQFLDLKLVKFRASVGPVMYFVVDQNGKCDQNNQSLDVEANNLTWGGALGLGIDVFLFTLDINYSFGLTNLFDKDDVTISGQDFHLDSTKESIFTVTLGVKLVSLGL